MGEVQSRRRHRDTGVGSSKGSVFVLKTGVSTEREREKGRRESPGS